MSWTPAWAGKRLRYRQTRCGEASVFGLAISFRNARFTRETQRPSAANQGTGLESKGPVFLAPLAVSSSDDSESGNSVGNTSERILKPLQFSLNQWPIRH